LSAELGGQIISFLKRAHKFGFSNKIHTVEEIAKEADETLFLKMKCNQHCLNPTLAIHKLNTHGLRPRRHMSFHNVGFSSATIRVLSGAYTDRYEDDAVLHCFIAFMFLFLRDFILLYYARMSVTCFK